MESRQDHPGFSQILKNELNFQELQKNFINFNKSTQLYECTICKLFISGVNTAYAHTNDSLHVKLFQNQIEKSVQKSTLTVHTNYTKLIANITARSVHGNFYRCYLCNLEFLDHEEIDKHIIETTHIKLLQNKKLCKKTLSQIDLLENSGKTLVENTITVKKDKYYCNVCLKTLRDIPSLKQHIKGKTHYLNWRKDKNKKYPKNPCNKKKSIATNISNELSKQNQSKVMRVSSSERGLDDQELEHSLNSIILSSANDTLSEASKFISKDNNVNKMTYKVLFENCIAKYKNSLACYLCRSLIILDDDKLIFEHINSASHNQFISQKKGPPDTDKMNVLSENQCEKLVKNFVIFKVNYYYCNLCELRVYSLIDINQHIDGNAHEFLLVKLGNNNKISAGNKQSFPKILLKKENLSISQTNKLKIKSETEKHRQSGLNNVKQIPENLKKSFKQRKSKSEERFPYNEDILNFSKRYFVRCLESGIDNIYNVDSEKIRFMLLGNSFVFNINHDRICILCNFKFPKNLQFLLEHLLHEVHIKNLCDVEESCKEPKKYSDQFNDMELIQSCMVDESDECVKCWACNVDVPNADKDIKIHINLESHNSKIMLWKKESESRGELVSKIIKDSWYFVDKFFCKVCNAKFSREISFAKHLEESDHMKKEKLNKTVNKINICYACLSCWYGESDYTNHYKENVHNHFMRINSFIFSNMKESAKKLLKMASKNIENLVKESDRARFQKDKETCLLRTVEETVKPIYPDCKAYIFGSRNSFLSFCSSDVDIFLDCENNYKNIGSKEACHKYINSIQNQFLVKYRPAWNNITVLLQPRVPLIKCEHKETGLKCDISFISGLAVEKTKLIRNYVIAYQPCRELILFLKKWFDASNLFGPQAVNAYGISWCVIFFLQIKGILPSVHQLKKLKNATNIIDGWECGFLENIPVAATNYCTKELLSGFFSFYAEFDYCNNILCPLLGKVLKKSTFISVNELPKEMEVYKNRFETEEMEYFRFDSPLCIQDPVDLSQNITKAVKKKQVRYFKNYCEESKKILNFSK